jgi:hypothetical protein
MAQIIKDPPDWYPIALGQVDRVFGDYVYRSISQISNSREWTEEALARFQTDTVRGIELRDLVMEKLQGIIALQRLSVTRESGDAVHGLQSET